MKINNENIFFKTKIIFKKKQDFLWIDRKNTFLTKTTHFLIDYFQFIYQNNKVMKDVFFFVSSTQKQKTQKNWKKFVIHFFFFLSTLNNVLFTFRNQNNHVIEIEADDDGNVV